MTKEEGGGGVGMREHKDFRTEKIRPQKKSGPNFDFLGVKY